MERFNKGFRFSDTLVNLTGQEISVYETSSGEIWHFPPAEWDLPMEPAECFDSEPVVHYILEKEDAEKLRLAERSLADIAVVCDSSRDRNGTIIYRLIWGEDATVPVLLHDGAYKLSIAHK